MKIKITGKVISTSQQWWFKINRKPIRTLGSDGAEYPWVIKVSYTVDGKTYIKRKWIAAGCPVPAAGASVIIIYDSDSPGKAKIL